MNPLSQSPARTSLTRRQRRLVAVVVLVAVQVPLGALSVQASAPERQISAYWPNAGLSVIALALLPRGQRLRLLPALYVVAVLANLVGGRPLDLALALGVVNLVAPLVAVEVLTRGNQDPPPLVALVDLLRLAATAVVGAVVGGLIAGGAVSLVAGGDFGATVRAVMASHGAALLLLVPFAMRPQRFHRRSAGPEVVVQWCSMLAASLVVFGPGHGLPLAFVPFPFLAWGALRLTTREVTVQLLAYGTLISWLTTVGSGPLYEIVEGTGHPPETVGTLLQLNIAAAALIALPLSLVRTQQWLTVERLTAQHDMVSNILDATTGNAILGTTLDARVEFFNIGAERISGRRAEDVVGRASLAAVPSPDGVLRVAVVPGDPPDRSLAERVEEMLARQSPASADWELVRPDGEVRTVSVVVNHRFGDDGTPIGYLGVADDVTDRRRREASIAAALETEKQLVDRLAQVDQTKNDFLATVSHELRTPITSILGYSELLLADDTGTLPPMHQQIVGRIERNGRRLLGLIEDMLTMSQVEVGNVRFDRTPLDLREPVARALETVEPTFAQHGVALVHELGESVKVLGDAEKLERVFANLLSNAAKFSHEGDTVVVRLGVGGDEAVFRVTDTGIGISLEDQAHLFDRFFRAAEAHARAIQGVGLGLPIAASIVAGHQGAIEVESALGRGSTFVVRLPLLTEDDPA